MVLDLQNGYEIDESLERVNFERVHAWLTTSSWSEGITRERVERGARHSALVISAYCKQTGEQAGYLRVVSDTTRFAYICDVWVDENHRSKGLARSMVRFALEHPDVQEVTRWLLATRDAHTVYQSVGFGPLPEPGRWMIFQPGQPGSAVIVSDPPLEG